LIKDINMKKGLLIILLSALIVFCLNAQQAAGTNVPEQTEVHNGSSITILRNTDFQTALKIIESLSLSEQRRNIVNTSSYTGGVPFQINNLPWREALRLITTTLNLEIEERPGVIIISDPVVESVPVVKTDVEEFTIHDKMVRINATFLKIDSNFSREAGIRWETLFRGQVNANVGFEQGSNPGSIGGVGVNPSPPGAPMQSWKWDQTTISLDALLNFIESSGKGEVVARPSITVLNGRDGQIHVGEEVTVILKGSDQDSERSYSAGIILRVSPVIIEEDGFEVIYLRANVENSSLPSDLSENATFIRVTRSNAAVDVMLFNGEETVIAGLMDSVTTASNSGIPLLRHLPWWLGGSLFRWKSNVTTQQEMVVILKAEIVAPAIDRAQEIENLRESFDRMRDDFHELKDDLLMSQKERDKKAEKED
jgi:type II secretory pathway component GspD/PulD (secretin)